MFWSHSCIPAKAARGCRGLQKNISIRRNAQKLAKAGQIAKAIQTYRPILESDADPYDYLYVGDLCVKAGDVEAAVGHYQSAIAHYRKLGFHRNAIALCRKILRIDGARHDVHRLLGLLYAADDLVGDALESYAIYLGGASPEEREEQPFRDAVVHACELAPRRATLALHLSEVLLGLGRTDDAADVLLRSAEVAHESGERELASELLAKAAEIDPGVTERVGQILAKQEVGDEAEASGEVAAEGPGGATRDDTREEVLAEIQTTFEGIGAAEGAPPPGDAPGSSPPAESPADDQGAEEPEAPGAVDDGEDAPPAHRDTMTCSGVEEKAAGARRSISFREIDLDAPEHDSPAAGATTEASPAEVEADEDEGRTRMPGVIEIDAQDDPGDAGHLADPAAATRLAMEAEQWTVAAKRVGEWLRADTQSLEAAEKLVEISEALQDNAGIVRGLILAGDLCIQDGDLPAAVPHFQRALTLDPGNETVQRRLARFAELGMNVEADPAAPEEVPAEVQNPGTIEEVLSSKEARVDVRAGQDAPDGDEAHQEWMELGALLEEFQEGIKQQVGEDDAQAHYDLGVSHMEMELFEEALGEFEQALAGEEAAGDFARRLHELRGTCLSRLGRHREAIHELRLGMETGEGSAAERNGLRYLLAREYQAVGEIHAAKESLRTLLAERPDDRVASALLAEIEGHAA